MIFVADQCSFTKANSEMLIYSCSCILAYRKNRLITQIFVKRLKILSFSVQLCNYVMAHIRIPGRHSPPKRTLNTIHLINSGLVVFDDKNELMVKQSSFFKGPTLVSRSTRCLHLKIEDRRNKVEPATRKAALCEDHK